MPVPILSIQSHVVFGHVGNSAAVFPLQRLGVEVWPIHTVQFSNHTGYGGFRGEIFLAHVIDECVTGLAERGVLPRCDAVLSGYVGTAETGAAVLRATARVKAANPAALYCCDPVIGDVGRGAFVQPDVTDFFRQEAVRAADILTPNGFELATLAGRTVHTLADFRAACDALHRAGPKLVVVTSLVLDDTPADAVDVAVSDGTSIWRLRTPRLPIAANGAGDVFAALFLVHYLARRAPDAALCAAASSVFGLLRRTVEAGSRELLLIDAQDEFVQPTDRYTAVKIA